MRVEKVVMDVRTIVHQATIAKPKRTEIKYLVMEPNAPEGSLAPLVDLGTSQSPPSKPHFSVL